MADANRCPNCGAERPANAPGGLCPRCLTRPAMSNDTSNLAAAPFGDEFVTRAPTPPTPAIRPIPTAYDSAGDPGS